MRNCTAYAPVSALLCLFGTLACSAPALAFQNEPASPVDSDGAQTCRVAEIHDGDTFSAYCDNATTKIRVSGIDTPELRQSYGPDASMEASRLLGYRTPVTLHPIEYDRYGRLVARVTLSDGRDLARELVRAGLGWHYVKYSRDRVELSKLEAEAREAKRGLWAAPDPEEPAAYRQRITAAARERREAAKQRLVVQ